MVSFYQPKQRTMITASSNCLDIICWTVVLTAVRSTVGIDVRMQSILLFQNMGKYYNPSKKHLNARKAWYKRSLQWPHKNCKIIIRNTLPGDTSQMLVTCFLHWIVFTNWVLSANSIHFTALICKSNRIYHHSKLIVNLHNYWYKYKLAPPIQLGASLCGYIGTDIMRSYEFSSQMKWTRLLVSKNQTFRPQSRSSHKWILHYTSIYSICYTCPISY